MTQLHHFLTRRICFVLTFISVLLAFHASSAASNKENFRGIKIRIKADDAPDSQAVEEIYLYSKSYALVIGIDNYHNGWPRLSNAVADAAKVAEGLTEKGFEVTFKKNLSSKELKVVFEEFFILKSEDSQARLFVWFAGHGHTLDGNGFLVPNDAPSPTAKAARFKYMALSMRRFGEFMRLANFRHTLVVFDCCFAGTIFETLRSTPPPTITPMIKYPVRQFLTSGDSNQSVSDNGLFAKLFLRAIKNQEGADLNSDGYLTGTELGYFMSDRITKLTNARQTPRCGKLLDEDYDRGDFVFLLPPKVSQKNPHPQPKINLFVNKTPKNAIINLQNIEENFYQGIALPTGKYLIEVKAEGYINRDQWVTLESGGQKHVDIKLERIPSPAPAHNASTTPSAKKAVRNLPPISF